MENIMENNNIIKPEEIKLTEVKINQLRRDLAFHKNMVTKTRNKLEEAKVSLKKYKVGFITS